MKRDHQQFQEGPLTSKGASTHQAEWRYFQTQGFDRHARRAYLAQISKRLASPLYGSMISASKAKEIIAASPFAPPGQPASAAPNVSA